MAADTGTDDFVVIHGVVGDGLPGCRTWRVTGIASITAVNVVSTLAGCDNAIVATDTSADDLVMIYCTAIDRRPRRWSRLVAGVTAITGIDMIHALAGCHNTIVTTDTAAIHLCMIHGVRGNRRPESREFFVAGIAHIRRINVIGSFAARGYAVMTGDTVIDKRCVVHRRRYPLLGTVAIVTFLRGGNMGRTFAGRNHIVVTAGAHTQYFRMINTALRHRGPGRWTYRMTGIAGISSIDVIGTFTGCRYPIVATDTGTNNLCVINIGTGDRNPWRRPGLMTGVTRVGSSNMIRAFS